MAVTLKLKNVEGLAEAFLLDPSVRPSVRMNLVITDPKVAEYAMIWEFGRVTCNPGPKTLWGTSPVTGETAVMTKTAPNGFIRANKRKCAGFIRAELKAIPWKKIKKFSQIPPEIEKAMERAAPQCADLIANTAPFDTYALRKAIRSHKVVRSTGTETVDILSLRIRAKI